MYFTRKAGDGRFAVILFSRSTGNGDWSTPEVASFSGRYADYDPYVAPDGSRLFFISTRPLSATVPKKDLDIWMVERAGSGWGDAQNLTAVNGTGDELYPTLAADGTLFFSSCGRPDSRGRCDLYRSRYRDGQFQAPENLGDSVNSAASETDVYIAPDQSYLVFAGYGRSDAVGDGDLYLSEFRGDHWTLPRLLGPQFNTVAREYCPIVSPDGRYFYFTSTRGFTDGPQQRALTNRLSDSLRRVRNGLGDVYRVPIEELR